MEKIRKQEFEITEKVTLGKPKRCRREKRGTLGSLVGGFIAIAIATVGLGIASEALKNSGVLNNGNSN